MGAKKKNTGICISSWKEKTPEGYTTDVGLTEEVVDKMCATLPEKFGAKVDHRRTRDRWIWVKPEYQVEARQYLIDNCGVNCVMLDISETWY